MQQTKFNFNWVASCGLFKSQKYKQISSSEVLQRGCSDINISTIYQKKQQLVMFQRKFLSDNFSALWNPDFLGNSRSSRCCVWWRFLFRMLHPTRNDVFIDKAELNKESERSLKCFKNISKGKPWKCTFKNWSARWWRHFSRRSDGHDGSPQLQHQFYYLLCNVQTVQNNIPENL